MAAAVVLCEVPLGVLSFQFALLLDELGLFYREEKDRNGDKHDRCNDDKQRLIVDMCKTCDLAVGVHDGSNAEVDNSAECAHEVNYRIALAAQGLGGDIRHKCDSRRAVGAHGNEQQTEHDDEGYRLKGAGSCGIAVIDNGQNVHEDDGKTRAEQDKRHTLAYLGVRAVGDGAEQRKQEQRKDIVRRHDSAGVGLVQVEGIRENEGYDAVVHLPECAYRQKGKARQYRALVIKFHIKPPIYCTEHFITKLTFLQQLFCHKCLT